ncbi:CTP-dependent riboflavin kinase [Thermococcus thermotolerans]|uniref:CTP-dependent riboflavin kinase n=1 Tax=Thermococcus thermotolerans TaxID=2969672 RepID=UPI00215878CC|nr:CTP-dependent riboflavin kinase [Thermococcus thermotolerans]
MKRIQMLILLARKGALGKKIKITLRELANELGISPQSVLRLLEEMEEEGLIEKDVLGRKTYVEISTEGLAFLESLCDAISEALYNGIIIGEVISGIGEGAYYVRQYSHLIREYLGFDPYPGTLNIRVLFPKTVFDAFCGVRPVILPGFSKEGRTFGDVKAYRVQIGDVEGAIVIPSRTVHPPKIAEIVAPVYLREKLGLKDGSRVTVKVVRG